MNNIGREEFKCISITCDIDGRDCDEDECCSTCPIAIEYNIEEHTLAFERYMKIIDPKCGSKTSKKYN